MILRHRRFARQLWRDVLPLLAIGGCVIGFATLATWLVGQIG